MSISLTVNKFFDPVMNLAKSSLAKIYQVLPAPAQKFFLGITTTKASPEVLKGLHADVSASEHAKALSKELNQLLHKVGDTATWFSDARQAGPYGITNVLQKILSSNPLPEELKVQFEQQGLDVQEYLSMALNPTHTGLVLKISPSSDNPEGLLFIHIDLRSQQPSKENLSPFNGELKIESLREVVKRSINFRTDFQFFKVGRIEDTDNFLTELQKVKKELQYYVPALFSKAIQILGNTELNQSLKKYLSDLTGKLPQQLLNSLQASLLNIRLPASSLSFHNTGDTSGSKPEVSPPNTGRANQMQETTVQPLRKKMVCSDLVAHLLSSKVKLDAVFQSVKSKLQDISQSPTPSNLYDTLRQTLYQNEKIKQNSLAYSFA